MQCADVLVVNSPGVLTWEVLGGGWDSAGTHLKHILNLPKICSLCLSLVCNATLADTGRT